WYISIITSEIHHIKGDMTDETVKAMAVRLHGLSLPAGADRDFHGGAWLSGVLRLRRGLRVFLPPLRRDGGLVHDPVRRPGLFLRDAVGGRRGPGYLLLGRPGRRGGPGGGLLRGVGGVCCGVRAVRRLLRLPGEGGAGAVTRNRIKEHRARRDMTQEELARLVGVRRETIGNLEKGR